MSKKLPFAEKVQRSMREHGLSLRSVCREAKLDASFFSKVLAGKRSPPSDEGTLRKLAAVLSVDPMELIVSTGRIPSEWQPLFKDPAVLASLARMSNTARPPAPHLNRTRIPIAVEVRGGAPVATQVKSFSDELL